VDVQHVSVKVVRNELGTVAVDSLHQVVGLLFCEVLLRRNPPHTLAQIGDDSKSQRCRPRQARRSAAPDDDA
jgi:hypothetical protein